MHTTDTAKYQIEIDESTGLEGAHRLALVIGGEVTSYVPGFDGDLPCVMVELPEDSDATIERVENELERTAGVAAFWRTL